MHCHTIRSMTLIHTVIKYTILSEKKMQYISISRYHVAMKSHDMYSTKVWIEHSPIQ